MRLVALMLQLAADGFQFVLDAVALSAHGVRLADLGGLGVESGGQVQGLIAHRHRNASVAQGRFRPLDMTRCNDG